MNISTYEARIAALEAQLGPGPSGGTGLLSVVVTPDVELSDNTTLNEKLAAMMPMEPGGEQRIEDKSAKIDNSMDYTITVTPASKWYGIISAGISGESIGETAGSPVSLEIAPVTSGDVVKLNFSAGASETSGGDGGASIVVLQLSKEITE